MAKYKAYPEYKTTGLGWLTEIPDHWEVKKLKYLGQAIIGLTYSPDDVVDEGEGTLVLRSSNVQNGKLEFLDNVYVRKSIPLYLKVKDGDILICARNGSRALIGKNAKITKDAEGMTFGAFMSIFRSSYNNYLSHVFASALFEYQSGSFLTATINQLTTSNLNSFEIPLPPQTEQDRIVNFLDHETAKIDNLIEKQQQLIELLKEKRQAVISHAVTKGLNPDVPMKDSGVEWLAEVPKHWVIPKIGYFCEVTKLTGFEYTNHWRTDENGEIIALRGFNIKERHLDLARTERISNRLSSKLSRSKLCVGDIVLPCTGTLGNACIIKHDNTFHINQNIAKLTFDENVYSEFASYWLTSEPFREMIDFNNTSGMQPVLLIGDIRNMPMPLPSFQEQVEISIYLSNKLTVYDLAIKHNEHAIKLLAERRTALISAAVTGKIDVRNWVAPDASDIEVSQEATA